MNNHTSIFTLPISLRGQRSQQLAPPPSPKPSSIQSGTPVGNASRLPLAEPYLPTQQPCNSTSSVQRTPQSTWSCERRSASETFTHRPSTSAGSIVVATTRAHSTTPESHHKRPSSIDSLGSAWQDGAQSSPKKRRLCLGNHHHPDLPVFPQVNSRETGFSSPLFFSRTPRPRPVLPPTSPSSEVAAALLMRTAEQGRRVMDARVNPPTAHGGTDALNRTDNPANDRLETDSDSDAIHILGQIGVLEFLEQDERPTFLIDLDDPSSFLPGPINVLFANAALRLRPKLLHKICTRAHQDSTGFPEFKSWLTKSAWGHHRLDLIEPTFNYNGVLWTCSTLRKTLRFVSGTYSSAPADSTSIRSVDGPRTSSTPQHGQQRESSASSSVSSENTVEEALIYLAGSTTNLESPLEDNSQEIKGLPSSDIESNVRARAMSHANESRSLSAGIKPPYQNGSAAAVALSPGITHGSRSTLDHASLDWTQMPISSLPPHLQFVRSVDWASTSLGTIENWSPTLRAMSNLIMASPHPAAMYWGDDHIALYNEAYVQLAGQKHPALMGSSYEVAWSEIWPLVKDVFANAKMTGQATMKDDDCLFMRRSGFLEETYFSWSIVPLIDENGQVVGLYNPAFELTRRKIAERRMLTLREIGERTATAREVKDFWGQVLEGLQYNEHDSPFVLLYSVSENVASDDSLTKSEQCVLEGAFGVPTGHQAAPAQIDLRSGSEGFSSVFREAMNTEHPVLLEPEDGSLSSDLIRGIDWRGFGDPCRAAVVCPIQPTTGDSMLGFLVMGINPRRPYDDDYKLFVQLLSRQLGTSLASVVLFEEEIRRGQRAARLAALDRIELSEQLAARTQEAVESETKFTRMAALSPVGMIIADPTGRINYCNETWHKLSGRSGEGLNTDDWIDSVTEHDQGLVHNLWTTLLEKQTPMTAEFRFRTPWEDHNGNTGETWVLASAYPEKDQDGVLKSIFGSVTDISQQKWAEGFQKRRMEEAVEMKRQQENFIDITSHEMRNPLSAILQCADGIATSLGDFRIRHSDVLPKDLLDSNIDAAQTVVLCAQHQKRIVDDILTLSKLDSALLLVTPVEIQPISIAQRALKMFEGEMATADIKTKFRVDESVRKLDVNWVKADPSRLLQVLINLLTNAIKFTTTQAKRTIIVSLSVSVQRPAGNETCGVSYFPTRLKRKDFTESSDWGRGQQVFIHFAVQDTGRGMSENEKKLLFQRFSQVSPRTHVQYGGSGLGLFISRELVELQGGEIGVLSERCKGSTFAFYVEARKSTAPADAIEPFTKPRSREAGYAQTTRNTALRDVAKKDHIKVLVVEDNLVNQRVLQQQLRHLSYTVYVANHGEEALDQLKQSTYWQGHKKDGNSISIVLMDVEMPVMDGLTCTRKIRELEKSGKLVRHVPIIAVTANARVEQIDTALEAGMDDVVSKPFRIPELIPKIEGLVAKYQNDSVEQDNTVSIQT